MKRVLPPGASSSTPSHLAVADACRLPELPLAQAWCRMAVTTVLGI